MPAINCDQFTKILDDKLNPPNSTISELKKSVNEAMSFLEVVNAKYDELLEIIKSSKVEKKALKNENKILKATIRSFESSLESVTRANNDLDGTVHSQRVGGNPRNPCCCYSIRRAN